jgi:hypothetical protein
MRTPSDTPSHTGCLTWREVNCSHPMTKSCRYFVERACGNYTSVVMMALGLCGLVIISTNRVAPLGVAKHAVRFELPVKTWHSSKQSWDARSQALTVHSRGQEPLDGDSLPTAETMRFTKARAHVPQEFSGYTRLWMGLISPSGLYELSLDLLSADEVPLSSLAHDLSLNPFTDTPMSVGGFSTSPQKQTRNKQSDQRAMPQSIR